ANTCLTRGQANGTRTRRHMATGARAAGKQDIIELARRQGRAAPSAKTQYSRERRLCVVGDVLAVLLGLPVLSCRRRKETTAQDAHQQHRTRARVRNRLADRTPARTPFLLPPASLGPHRNIRRRPAALLNFHLWHTPPPQTFAIPVPVHTHLRAYVCCSAGARQ
ncbi:hypothetical protein B0H14DRAFT_2928440, partial [Mycena olivaceomarginata]